MDPSTQSPANQQAYLGSLAERFLPVDLSYRGVRVLNVDPPIFAIPDFVTPGEADALAALAKGGKKLVRNVKRVEICEKLPAPMGDGMPALVQRLGELVDDCKRFVRCDGAWLEGSPLNNWGTPGGFVDAPPPGAFAFETPVLCVTGKVRSPTSSPTRSTAKTPCSRGIPASRRARSASRSPTPPSTPRSAPRLRRVNPRPRLTATASGSNTPSAISRFRRGRAPRSSRSPRSRMARRMARGLPRLARGQTAAWIDFPISVGLDEGGIAKPVSMEDVVVEKVGEEGNIGEAARNMNRQAWRASVSGGDGDGAAGVAEEARRRSSRSSRTPGCDRRATPVRKHHLHVLRLESFARDRIPPSLSFSLLVRSARARKDTLDSVVARLACSWPGVREVAFRRFRIARDSVSGARVRS